MLASSDRALIGHVDVRAVRRLIECAARQYRYVVLDVPRSDATMLDALDPATRIVVVANQELATVRSAGRMAAALRQRYGKGRVAVVVSRFDQQAEIGRKDIERVIGGPVADVFPSNYRAGTRSAEPRTPAGARQPQQAGRVRTRRSPAAWSRTAPTVSNPGARASGGLLRSTFDRNRSWSRTTTQ